LPIDEQEFLKVPQNDRESYILQKMNISSSPQQPINSGESRGRKVRKPSKKYD
jgi:hypothetical protein